MLLALVAKASIVSPCVTTCEMSLDLSELLDEFNDVSLDNLPAELPPLKDIQHDIDLVLGSTSL